MNLTFNLRKIFFLIQNTFAKEYRNKMLILLFIFTVIILLVVNVIVNMFFQSDEGATINMLLDLSSRKFVIFYGLISIWNGILCSILAVNTLKSDMEYGITQQILSLPLRSSEYVLSRTFGTWLLVVSYYLVSLILSLCVYGLTADLLGKIAITLQAFTLTSLSLLVVIIVGIFLSLFLPKLLALLGTLLMSSIISFCNTYVSTSNIDNIKHFFENKLNIFIYGVHYLFPRMGLWGGKSNAILSQKEFEFSWFWESLHYGFTLTLALTLLCLAFKWRRPSII